MSGRSFQFDINGMTGVAGPDGDFNTMKKEPGEMVIAQDMNHQLKDIPDFKADISAPEAIPAPDFNA